MQQVAHDIVGEGAIGREELLADVHVKHMLAVVEFLDDLVNFTDLEARGIDRKELLAAREAIDPSGTVAVMHGILHQPDFEVSSGDLRALWGRLEQVVKRMWDEG